MDRFKFRIPYFKADKFAGYTYRALVYNHIEWVKDDWADWVSKSDALTPRVNEQCTGLKDKNGALIYENDIISFECRTGIVRFGNYSNDSVGGEDAILGFYIEWQGRKVLFRQDMGYWGKQEIEVIGNTHTLGGNNDESESM